MSDKPDREQRLAEALRLNLRRRKAQSRGAVVNEAPSAPPVPGRD